MYFLQRQICRLQSIRLIHKQFSTSFTQSAHYHHHIISHILRCLLQFLHYVFGENVRHIHCKGCAESITAFEKNFKFESNRDDEFGNHDVIHAREREDNKLNNVQGVL
uniref:Uncharacterized protein n=1 Tax=Cacopsylla melanoneura TaxID=428564 RepID=A0A8D8TR82_9HEMI